MAKKPQVLGADKTGRYQKELGRIAEKLSQALLYLKKPNSAVGLNFVLSNRIRDLNWRFRRKNSVTTVLSFPEPAEAPPVGEVEFLGEIFLAPAVIKRKKEDLVFLAVHGLLHLLGYTHNSNNDTIKMKRLEKKLMKIINS